jgi:3-methyladenine DNA glycosylase AlkC
MNDNQPPQKFFLKDHLFNRQKVAKIAQEIKRVYPAFDAQKFTGQAVAKFPSLELKARIGWIAECLKQSLPSDYPSAIAVLLKSLPHPNDPSLSDDDFGDFIYAPYADFVARYGCNRGSLKRSLKALKEITMRFSAEDAIRYFINAFPEETLGVLQEWSSDNNYHVRRLCSEGTRPKLPWSQKLNIPVSEPLPILDKLFYDPTRYVTRSVANHINDISKSDPDLAIEILTRWRDSKKQNPKEMEYILKHALRTLVKDGNREAIHLLGFSQARHIRVTHLNLPKAVAMNTHLEFSCVIEADEDTEALVDYILYFQNKAGELSSKKVFKLGTFSIGGKIPITLSKRHLLRQFMTTRTLYAGKHALEIQINGVVCARAEFELHLE